MAHYEERECSKHGLTTHRKGADKRWVCKACHKGWVKKLRQGKRQKLIDHHGGKCIICGYNKCTAALVFHHRDPSSKCFILGQNNRSYKVQLEESKKCDLLCHNCHAEEHERLSNI